MKHLRNSQDKSEPKARAGLKGLEALNDQVTEVKRMLTGFVQKLNAEG